MKFTRWFAIAVVVTLGVSMLGATAGAQSSSSEKPKATDVGITEKEIHVAVIADVDSPLAPNLFVAAVDGMKGWAKYINSKAGGGGLAGRKVVIDFYDSKLNPAETKNAEITACQNDVAARDINVAADHDVAVGRSTCIHGQVGNIYIVQRNAARFVNHEVFAGRRI